MTDNDTTATITIAAAIATALDGMRPEIEAVLSRLDYADLACEIDTSEIASEIDICNIASEIACEVDASDIAAEMSFGDVASAIDLDDLADHIHLDLADLAAKIGSGAAAVRVARRLDRHAEQLAARENEISQLREQNAALTGRLVKLEAQLRILAPLAALLGASE